MRLKGSPLSVSLILGLHGQSILPGYLCGFLKSSSGLHLQFATDGQRSHLWSHNNLMALGGVCFSSSSHPGEETGLQTNEQGIMVSTVPRDGLLLSTDGNLLVGTTVFTSGCCQPPV